LIAASVRLESLTHAEEEIMATDTSVFEVIDRLSQSLPLDPAKVSAILGVPLEHDPAGDNPVMTSYKQPASVSGSRFKAVELRIPHPVFGKGAGLLSATLNDDEGLDSNAVLEHYGLEFQQDVPSPRYPPDTPAYYTYEQPWGDLSLGVSNDKAARLVSFVMEPKNVP
jgi:hypothetical protein